MLVLWEGSGIRSGWKTHRALSLYAIPQVQGLPEMYKTLHMPGSLGEIRVVIDDSTLISSALRAAGFGPDIYQKGGPLSLLG